MGLGEGHLSAMYPEVQCLLLLGHHGVPGAAGSRCDGVGRKGWCAVFASSLCRAPLASSCTGGHPTPGDPEAHCCLPVMCPHPCVTLHSWLRLTPASHSWRRGSEPAHLSWERTGNSRPVSTHLRLDHDVLPPQGLCPPDRVSPMVSRSAPKLPQQTLLNTQGT